MDGWMGKGLEVDLTAQRWELVDLDPDLLRSYLGGRGIGVKLVRDRMSPSANPLAMNRSGSGLDPSGVLVFAAGPLTGTRTPTSGRHAVVSKSPLTGTMFDANAGGRFGAELKFAGLDYIAVTGRADRPVFLAIKDDQVSLEDASHLWGRNCYEVLEQLSEFKSVSCIGRAGEKGVLFASIMNDGHAAAARGGLGAVMGSKNLKAIAISGSHRPSIADPDLFRHRLTDITRLLVASPVSSKGLAEYGTPVLVNLINYMKVMPTGNFRESIFEQAEDLSGETIADTFSVRRIACHACPIACKRKDKESGRQIPEYETLAMLGPDCSNSDLETVVAANNLCNDYGMDTITAGATLACYSEIAGRNLSPEEMLDLIRQIGENQGTGAELAQGSMRYAISQGRAELSMSVKGLELPGYDPRGVLGLALGYATSNRGGCHLRAYMIGPEIFGKPKLIDRTSWSGKSGLVRVFQDIFTAVDCLVVCKFALFSVGEEEWANILSAVTGVEFVSEDIIRVGERIWNMERLFNIEAGFGAQDDALPERFFTEGNGRSAPPIDRQEFQHVLAEYYMFRGWDREGVPTPAKLAGLGLGK